MKFFQCLLLLSFLLTDLHESTPQVITQPDPDFGAPIDMNSLSTIPFLPSTYARPLQFKPRTNSTYEVRFSGALLKPLEPKTSMNELLKFIGSKYSLSGDGRIELWSKVKILLAPPADQEKITKVLYNLNGWRSYNDTVPVNSDGGFVGKNFILPITPSPYERIKFKVSFTDKGKEHWADGDAQVIPDDPNGWSIVADIDDTIRVTGIYKFSAMFKNTFIEPLRAVDGMAEVFNSLGNVLSVNGSQTVFHYLSGSPIAYLNTNQQFMSEFKFPSGAMHFQEFAVSQIQAIAKLNEFSEFKLNMLKRLVTDFPHRNFVFMGNSGKTDPQVYGDMFRSLMKYKSGASLPCIYIRLVTGVDTKKEARLNTVDRFRWEMRGIPADRWMVFTDAAELNGINPSSGSCYPPNKNNTWVGRGQEHLPTRPVKNIFGMDVIYKEKFGSVILRNMGYLYDQFNVFLDHALGDLSAAVRDAEKDEDNDW